MGSAVHGSTVFVIHRKRKGALGQDHSKMNIVVISDNSEIRIQQKLDKPSEMIPYTTWGNHFNVNLRIPATLTFYDDVYA